MEENALLVMYGRYAAGPPVFQSHREAKITYLQYRLQGFVDKHGSFCT